MSIMKGKELREIRTRLGWSVEYAAKQCSCSVQRWYNMEQGRTLIPGPLAHFIRAEGSISRPVHLLPRNLKHFRTRFSLTQNKAAVLVGVSRTTWSQWENGKKTIPTYLHTTLIKIGRTLTGD